MPQTNCNSETQQLCSQINAPYNTSKALSFTDCWVNTTVEKEILRGRELCQQKPRKYCKDRIYNVINIEAPKVGKSRMKYCGKITQNKYNQMKKNPSSPRSRSPFLRSSSPSKTYNPPRSRPKYSISCTRKCPLRIAELAVPTKRQCIDTWRTKNDILPGYMIERLRREVMNEKPIVKIPDAIHYFKKRNTPVIKCNQKVAYDVFVKKQKKINPKRLQKELEHPAIKKLCAQFGHKIAQKLIKPLNIVLNRNLSKLSEVIAHDIFGMMEKQKKISTNNKSYRVIQSEMASKVAIWIHNIMEDSLYKLMGEDLKDLEEEEGPVLDLLDELVENILNTCEPIPEVPHNISSAESIITKRSVYEVQQLEKSHSTDITNASLSDHVASSINGSENDAQINTTNLGESTIDKIISDESLITEYSIIEKDDFEKSLSNENFPEKVTINKSVSDEASYKESTSEAILEDLASINDIEMEYKSGIDINERISETVETKNDNLRDNLSELITNELLDIILNIDKDIEGIPIETVKDYNLDNNDVINEDFLVESEHGNLEVKSSKPSSDSLTKELKQTATYDVTETEDSLVIIEHEDDFGDGDGEETDILETTAKKNEDHVSEVFTILTKESDDDRNKKVKFFETNMVMDENNQDSASESSIKKIHDEIIQHERDILIWKSSSEFIKPDIELQQPNERLLSDADESWPKEIPSPILKPSASVSKSITSLGRILESDETFQNSDKSDSNIDIVSSIKNKPEINNIGYKEENIKSKDKHDDFETDIVLNPVDKEIEIKTSISIKGFTENENMKGKSSYELVFNIDEDLRSLVQQFLHKDEKKRDIGTACTKSQNLFETFVMETDLAGGEKPFETVAIAFTNHKTVINSKKHSMKDEDKQKSKISEVILENVMQQNSSKEGSDEVAETIKYFCPSPKKKRDYRVNPLTAPSWVMQDCDEPSKKSLALRSETEILKKFKESDIRKWNKNLDEAFANLRLWGDWIHNTCNIIIEMHERERVLKSERSDVKNWIALKKNIDNDANLWTKLNQCTQRKFKRFHRTHKKHSKVNLSIKYHTNRILLMRREKSHRREKLLACNLKKYALNSSLEIKKRNSM